jgi:hypothetical protein
MLTIPKPSTTAAYIYQWVLLCARKPKNLTDVSLALTNGEKELLAQIAALNPVICPQKYNQRERGFYHIARVFRVIPEIFCKSYVKQTMYCVTF